MCGAYELSRTGRGTVEKRGGALIRFLTVSELALYLFTYLVDSDFEKIRITFE